MLLFGILKNLFRLIFESAHDNKNTFLKRVVFSKKVDVPKRRSKNFV